MTLFSQTKWPVTFTSTLLTIIGIFSSSLHAVDSAQKDPFFNLFAATPMQQTYTLPTNHAPTPANQGQYAGHNANTTQTNPFLNQIFSTMSNQYLGYSTPIETIPQNTNMRVLLLGQTGSGKSTFLNMAANYLLYGAFGKDLEMQKRLKIIIPTRFLVPNEPGFSHSEFNTNNQGKSQTSKPKSYRLGLDGRFITFIDTPGMGDTRGIDRDEKNLEKILEKASKVGELAGIVLFFNGAETRDTTTKEYSFTKLKGFIPDVALKNMIVVLTNARKDSCNFPIEKIEELGVSKDRIFYMQNSVLASDPSTWQHPETLNHLALDWEDSMKTMSSIVKKLSGTSLDISNEFKRMYELRNFVKSEFHKVIMTFSNMQETQTAIAIYESQFKSESSVAKDFKNYAEKATVKTRKFVDNPSLPYSTICTAHHTICHSNCGLQETHTVGDAIFTGCTAFSGSNGKQCSVCSTKKPCSYQCHYHGRGEFMEIEETLQDRLEEYKSQYDKAHANAKKAKKELGSAQEAFEQMQNTIDQFAEDVEEKLEELKKLCTGYNFVGELHATIQVLKQETSRYTSCEALDSAEKFILALEAMANRLTEQGYDKGTTSDAKECSGFGYQIRGTEIDDMTSKSKLSYIKERLKLKKNKVY